MASLIAPKINLNGTSKESLREEFQEIAHSLRASIEKLSNSTVHGRDYQYDGGEDDFKLARKQHNDRIERVQKVYDEIMMIWENVEDQ